MATTLFIPATLGSAAEWAKALARHQMRIDGEHLEGHGLKVGAELIANDGYFAGAFFPQTTTDAQRAAIGNAAGALILYIEQPLQEIASPLAKMVDALAQCGALAVRIEQSKLGFPVKDWVDMVGSGNPWSLYRAAIVVLPDGDAIQSCGMHVFALPDARAAMNDHANALLGAFNVFQIADDPVLRSGETFSPDAESPRRTIQREPDVRYPPDDICHNPFGVWSVGPEGGKSVPHADLLPVFIPPLVVLLKALEEKKGSPLTQTEVLAIRDKGVCMMMTGRDAQMLERKRGYADIDPERAYEQLQMLRRS